MAYVVCAVLAAHMYVATFDLGRSDSRAALRVFRPVEREALAERPPMIISGLPEDAGTLRR